MKEIVLGLLAIGSAPFSADKIQDFLDNRPEPIEQKIDALSIELKILCLLLLLFIESADEYLKQYES
jgi:hypothetical protein